jgi:hypothetical protein
MTEGHGVRHTHTKYTEYVRHKEFLQYKYYKDFIYNIMDQSLKITKFINRVKGVCIQILLRS